ncbi:hypothetical protein D1610_02140 [Sphingomonas gilva]|uniref:Uncharacterized protein n=1 Tax=Sphingomonas gilva TaxID=2305907 RepID=A0A396RR13_9SPHN|nr:hypothetical protein [Sphingomonas gilva]RHW18958.1 hypothetical protein D1610_02140 [Sphingomonas gilva]
MRNARHKALAELRSIHEARRYAAECALADANRDEAVAQEKVQLVQAATGEAVADWAAHVQRAFDPALARALSRVVDARMSDTVRAEEEARRAAERSRARAEDWHRSDAHARQSDALLARSKRVLARKREALALDALSDLTVQRWSRS